MKTAPEEIAALHAVERHLSAALAAMRDERSILDERTSAAHLAICELFNRASYEGDESIRRNCLRMYESIKAVVKGNKQLQREKQAYEAWARARKELYAAIAKDEGSAT